MPAVASLPLVSVLVRSLDRPELQEALASIALQSHPRIEVIVVAVHAGHAPVAAAAGLHPVRLLPTDVTRPRSLAANTALDSALGDYLIFLDDDDWLMPDHIARLVAALQTQAGAMAAYAGVMLVDAERKPLGQVFDLPFDAVRLLSGNLTPIHAVLFSARLPALGCRFDEALDRYEDWDFWIQVSRHTVPVHVPGISAVYRIHDSSGVHSDAGADSVSSHRIHAKWLQHCTPGQLGDLMRRVWAHDELAQRLQVADAEVTRGAVALAQTVGALAEQGATMRELQSELHAVRVELQSQARAAELRHQHSEQLVQQLQTRLAEQQARSEELVRDLSAAAHLVSSLQLDKQALIGSTSWRLTAPMRAVLGWLRRGRGTQPQ